LHKKTIAGPRTIVVLPIITYGFYKIKYFEKIRNFLIEIYPVFDKSYHGEL